MVNLLTGEDLHFFAFVNRLSFSKTHAIMALLICIFYALQGENMRLDF
ncbi:conserved hypothetical protein [delta proteobacterium NaphS2]|nr:conserved hypothetical protein [delta proteobacterium NaphS2]